MYETQIANGMRYLDEAHPGWEKLINHHELDMRYGNTCILGQIDRATVYADEDVYPSYCNYLNDRDLGTSWAIDHGFAWSESEEGESEMGYRMRKIQLTTEWLNAILARRAENMTVLHAPHRVDTVEVVETQELEMVLV